MISLIKKTRIPFYMLKRIAKEKSIHFKPMYFEVAFVDSIEETQKMYNLPENFSNSIGLCFIDTEKKTIVVILTIEGLQDNRYNLVSHEVAHAVNRIYYFNGNAITVDNDEIYAELTGWLNYWVQSIIDENKEIQRLLKS